MPEPRLVSDRLSLAVSPPGHRGAHHRFPGGAIDVTDRTSCTTADCGEDARYRVLVHDMDPPEFHPYCTDCAVLLGSEAAASEVEELRREVDRLREKRSEAVHELSRVIEERDAARNGRQGADAAVRVLEAKGDRLRAALGKLDWLTSSPGDMRSEDRKSVV